MLVNKLFLGGTFSVLLFPHPHADEPTPQKLFSYINQL